MTPWKAIPGATQSDHSYLTGAGVIHSGFRSVQGGVDVYGDPEFMDVWLTQAGVEDALSAQDRNREQVGYQTSVAPRPDPWRDEAKSANERVYAYAMHLALNGARVRPTCTTVAAATGVPEPTIRNTPAWKNWPKVDLPGGGLSEQHRADRGGDWARAEKDRIRDEGDDERE